MNKYLVKLAAKLPKKYKDYVRKGIARHRNMNKSPFFISDGHTSTPPNKEFSKLKLGRSKDFREAARTSQKVTEQRTNRSEAIINRVMARDYGRKY